MFLTACAPTWQRQLRLCLINSQGWRLEANNCNLTSSLITGKQTMSLGFPAMISATAYLLLSVHPVLPTLQLGLSDNPFLSCQVTNIRTVIFFVVLLL